MPKRKILQIMPANEWNVIYRGDEGNIIAPLVCWALVEEDEDGTLVYNVIGMDSLGGYVEFSDDCSNFIGYEKL